MPFAGLWTGAYGKDCYSTPETVILIVDILSSWLYILFRIKTLILLRSLSGRLTKTAAEWKRPGSDLLIQQLTDRERERER